MRSMRLRGGARSLAIAFSALFVTAACEVSLGPTGREDVQDPISISFGDGQTLRKGDLISVNVELPESSPEGVPPESAETPPEEETEALPRTASSSYAVEVLLESSTGLEISSRVFPYDQEGLPGITLDDLGLASQRYRLIVRLLRGTELMAHKSVEFYYVGEEYEIQEVSADSPTVHPGSTVLLTAILKVPEGGNPYIEWSAGNSVFARGELSEGTDAVEWVAPDTEGIFAVTAKLYPLGRAGPSESLSTDVYASFVRDPVGDLGPEDSYLALFHFLGDLTDAGTGHAVAGFLAGNPLPLITRGKVVGYLLDGERGIVVPSLLLPVADQTVQPFTVTVGLTPSDRPLEGSLFRTATGDGTVELSLGFEAAPSIVVEMRRPDGLDRLIADASALLPGKRTVLSFSLYPALPEQGADAASAEGAMTAALFVDGLPVASAEWGAVSVQHAGGGTTNVGGAGGARVLLDELGVYQRDEQGRPSPDQGIYRRAVRLEQGPKAFADGFDGPFLDGSYAIEGDVAASAGILALEPDSAIRLVRYLLTADGVALRVDLARTPSPGAVLEISGAVADQEELAPLLSVRGDGTLEHGGLIAGPYRFAASGVLLLTLRPGTGSLLVSIDGLEGEGSSETLSLPTDADGTGAIVVELANAPDAEGSVPRGRRGRLAATLA